MTTTHTPERPHAVISAAARGDLPSWTQARPARRAHMGRVAELMAEWASQLQLSAAERLRWTAAAWLHDTLRDADPETMRDDLDHPFRTLPGSFLHGPAAAAHLERDGVTDAALLQAVRYHTLGKAGLPAVGRALICADYLEPGRPQFPVWRAALRARMPAALDAVFREVVSLRLRFSLERGMPLRPEFVDMWNEIAVGHAATR